MIDSEHILEDFLTTDSYWEAASQADEKPRWHEHLTKAFQLLPRHPAMPSVIMTPGVSSQLLWTSSHLEMHTSSQCVGAFWPSICWQNDLLFSTDLGQIHALFCSGHLTTSFLLDCHATTMNGVHYTVLTFCCLTSQRTLATVAVHAGQPVADRCC